MSRQVAALCRLRFVRSRRRSGGAQHVDLVVQQIDGDLLAAGCPVRGGGGGGFSGQLGGARGQTVGRLVSRSLPPRRRLGDDDLAVGVDVVELLVRVEEEG